MSNIKSSNYVNKTDVDLVLGLSSKHRKQLLFLAISAAIRNDCFDSNIVSTLPELLGCNLDAVYNLMGIYGYIIKLYLQTSKQQFMETLLTLGFTKSFIKELPFENESVSSFLSADNHVGIPKLSSFKWRIDISFACGSVPQLRPVVIISFNLNDGRHFVFEVDYKTFHRLRFNVTLALNEVRLLQNSYALKKKF